MLTTLSTYIPMDRRQAIAAGTVLPAQAHGSALFADISGFTPLTDVLTTTFGMRRGAEEITRYLNLIYDGLTESIHQFGGSVISFSGDAILCWFNDSPDDSISAPSRAVAAASAMQRKMEHAPVVTLPGQASISFALKIAVTTGTARRFIVGNPAVQLIDVLAGSVVDRLGDAQHLAHKREIAIDALTLAQLTYPVELAEWRQADNTDAQFAIIRPGEVLPSGKAWFSDADVIDEARLSAWLMPALRARVQAGLQEFETELRPATSMFVRFHGIDFEHDPDAGTKLDAFTRFVQDKLILYEGTLLQVSLGDKGSYLYIGFGAPVAHEDDAARAVSVALELRTLPVDFNYIVGVQIGIAHGMMRVGSYGGTLSRTYGILGDDANLAARLMQKAGMNEILGSGRIQRQTADSFTWHILEHIHIKGKSKPIAVAQLVGKLQLQLDATSELGRLLGREAELSQLADFFRTLPEERFAGVAYIYGESGMGKSRVAYDLKRQLHRAYNVHWLTCTSDNLLRRSLYPIKTLLREYFDQFERSSEEGNQERFAFVFDSLLETALPELQQSLRLEKPFLGGLVDLHWPDSIYELADPKERFESTLWALRTFIEALSQQNPLILHFENAHWFDAETKQLIQFLVKHVRKARWGVVITSRDDEATTFDDLYQQGSVRHCSIGLTALTDEARRAVTMQILGGNLAPEVITFITNKTGGNPFFIEHLILDMRECGTVVKNANGIWQLNQQTLNEVPVSISAVLTTRLDRLPTQVKTVVQHAAVLGERFESAVLAHMLSSDPHLMDKIEQAEAQAIWTKKDNAVIEFQHPLLRDTAYENQLQAQVKELHAIAALAIQAVNAHHLDAYATDLAYHYRQAEQPDQERKYAHMAGELAARRYSNAEALRYLNRALELTPPDDLSERYRLLILRENIYDVQGDRAAQHLALLSLTEIAEQLALPRHTAEVALRRANYTETTSNYRDAITAAQQAARLAQVEGAQDIEAASLLIWGRSEGWLGEYAAAQEHLMRALELAQAGGQYVVETACLRNLGLVAFAQGDYAQAETYQQTALKLSRSRADRRGESNALTNLARLASQRNHSDDANRYQDIALQLSRDTGDRVSESSALNLYQLGLSSKTDSHTRRQHQESLRLSREIGNRRGECTALCHLGMLALDVGNYPSALQQLSQSLAIAVEISYRSGEIRARTLLARLHQEKNKLDLALEQVQLAVAMSGTLGARPEQANALLIYGYILLALGRAADAANAFLRAIHLWQEMERAESPLEAQVGWAYAIFLTGDAASARKQISMVLNALDATKVSTLTDPLRMYLTCFRLLHALQDSRATSLLDQGYSLMQDQHAQRVLQKQNAVQRELMAAWIWNDQQ